MKAQANRNYRSNDDVMTPDDLAFACVDVLQPSGIILEPCPGTGAFLVALRSYGPVLTPGMEGFTWWSQPVDWIITNPPWSDFARFLRHALELATHVAFLVTVNHWWTKARVCSVQEAGFGYRALWLCDWPREWPSSGFQLGLMHLERGYSGALDIQYLSKVRSRG